MAVDSSSLRPDQAMRVWRASDQKRPRSLMHRSNGGRSGSNRTKRNSPPWSSLVPDSRTNR
eukprot:4396640-Prymnesium_polylepis.1